NGAYAVRYYNCMTGSLQSTEPVTVTNGSLSLVLPDMLWDWAFVVDDQPLDVAEVEHNLDFQVYPNPAIPGANMTLGFDLQDKSPLTVTLLDMEGRTLRTLFSGDTTGGEQQLGIALPGDLAAGVYWVKMEGGDGKVGVTGINVLR
ncbi:MAG TPA: T9SS type A sorting domain-containing protein, partial [Saprospiraceae bacterium]|nr:T9SS type A sorting domain-containing protein [Saprospiraceae bacterium]